MESFLKERKTQIIFSGYEGKWIHTSTGIPQGLLLFSIFFLFFILKLLEHFKKIKNNTLGFGFVDNTNLVAWGGSTADNYRRLTAAHNRCIVWAKRHGTRFTPDKYALMHFIRKKRDPYGDLASTVNIKGWGMEIKKTKLQVLGV